MRQGFTLIELMIVIAIIAIIAAIAIPNLLESRVTANESAAAASLKSGFHPAQTQFQAGAYSDADSNGRGEYAADERFLAGAYGTTAPNSTVTASGSGATSTTINGATSATAGWTTKPLNLLPPTFNVADGSTVGAYKFAVHTNTIGGSIDDQQSYFGVSAWPATAGDGRRAFAIDTAGAVYATKQSYATTNLLGGVVTGGLVTNNVETAAQTWTGTSGILASDPRSAIGPVNTTNAVPYQK